MFSLDHENAIYQRKIWKYSLYILQKKYELTFGT